MNILDILEGRKTYLGLFTMLAGGMTGIALDEQSLREAFSHVETILASVGWLIAFAGRIMTKGPRG